MLFKYNKLKENQEKFELQVEFNKAILLLEKEEYEEAIESFKKTSKLLKIPSFLNIGIAYYKLNQIDNALLYLNNIYDYKEASFSNTYSYISASYYLYLIKKDRKYLETIIDITKKFSNLTEHSKRLVADSLILLKDYEKALKVLDTMQFPMYLKKAMLYLKLNDFKSAERYLESAKKNTLNQTKIDLILWLMIYRDLKANEIAKLLERLKEVEKVKSSFKINQEHPLKIFFNKNKYTTKEYLSFITNFSEERKIDFLFYFAPFVFSDKQEVLYDISKGFVFKDKQSVESLEEMVKYNAKFIDIIKEDPIIRVNKMKSFIKEDSNSYIYYNLALCYAQISDFHNAYKYFSKAYKLNPGNKLYSVMTLITAEITNKRINDKEYILQNIQSKNGMYKYFGQRIYSLFLSKKASVVFDPLNYKNTIFFKALDYLDKLEENNLSLDHPLFTEHYKDPLIYLMKATLKREGENDYNYFARLQDTIPLKINGNFLKGPIVVTKYYIDLLKAIGLFHKADLTLKDDNSPSYLRIKAFNELYNNNPKESLKILQTLQKEYKLEDKFTMYLIVSAQLEDGKYNEALLQIALIKAILKDKDADFLSGIQLIQELKLNSSSQYFTKPYSNSLIDFKIIDLDELLETL
ncbi:hypothetical protein CP965_11920 [Halarcobacter mediterraneus]|uniref:Tetratricopeptide repeat protein n=1 Tax=Halarcobacter mediterraneus TaxID=2023153 RepID=A0A4V1M133_9BACT|nr:hypothetical protein CP965_11920 [Halarcobacter mediterraneus]